MLRGLFDPVEVVWVFAKVDEVAGGVVGVGPRDDENGIIVSAFDGRLGEHLFIVASC